MNAQKKKFWMISGIVYATLLLLVVLVINLSAVNEWLGRVLWVLRPVIIGLIIAYLLNPFFRFFEKKVFKKISPFGVRRGISLFFSYVSLFLILFLLIMLIVPQLVDSILNFIDQYESYLHTTTQQLNELIKSLNDKLPSSDGNPLIPYLDAAVLQNSISSFFKSLDISSQTLMQYLTADNLFTVLNIASNIVSIITDIIFGLFISIYLLATKEKRYAQIMRMRAALFSDKTNEWITRLCTTADRSFGGFLEGKIIDSMIIGVLTYIFISIFDVPYAILIATIVGITDIVPVIGPFIGVIPSALIILLTDPPKVIIFLICILIIQQIDGNIIAPKILGENTGVSSLCVIIAITTMGSLGGLVGMILGVPLFATVLELSNFYLEKRLRKKGVVIQDASEETPHQAPAKKHGIISRFKKKAVRLQGNRNEGGEGDLTQLEKIQLETYKLAVKYHIFSESSDDAMTRFAAEKTALLNVVENAEKGLEEDLSQFDDNQNTK